MYRIEDHHSAIKVVQRMLGLNEIGIYDEKTRKSVAEYQLENGLNSNGVVDYYTFESLKKKYARENSREIDNAFSFLAKGLPYQNGDMNTNLSIINSLLGGIMTDYKLEGILPRGNFYGYDTSSAVLAIRKLFLLEERTK